MRDGSNEVFPLNDSSLVHAQKDLRDATSNRIDAKKIVFDVIIT